MKGIKLNKNAYINENCKYNAENSHVKTHKHPWRKYTYCFETYGLCNIIEKKCSISLKNVTVVLVSQCNISCWDSTEWLLGWVWEMNRKVCGRKWLLTNSCFYHSIWLEGLKNIVTDKTVYPGFYSRWVLFALIFTVITTNLK